MILMATRFHRIRKVQHVCSQEARHHHTENKSTVYNSKTMDETTAVEATIRAKRDIMVTAAHASVMAIKVLRNKRTLTCLN